MWGIICKPKITACCYDKTVRVKIILPFCGFSLKDDPPFVNFKVPKFLIICCSIKCCQALHLELPCSLVKDLYTKLVC